MALLNRLGSVSIPVRAFGPADAFLGSERPDVPSGLILDIRLRAQAACPGFSRTSSAPFADARSRIVMEFRDGKVVHETQYFSEPFEAPAWRNRWIEQIA